jgi:hypothetical protein
MAFTIDAVRSIARGSTKFSKSASVILDEATSAQARGGEYDIFLSHAFSDAELILGVKMKLEGYGHSVYVDWLNDPQLDRSQVSRHTAAVLRQRMNQCRCLFYSTTHSSSNSKWMPWECGFVDGRKGKSAILPVTQYATNDYQGQEYLGIYPYITEENNKDGKSTLYVNHSPSEYCTFREWLAGKTPTKRS